MDEQYRQDNLSEQERIELTLRAYEQRYPALFSISLDGIISIDHSQKIIYFNKAAQNIFGYDAAELIGKPIDMLLPVRFKEAHDKHIKGFANSLESFRLMNTRGEIMGLRKEGSEFPIEATISKLNIDGEMVYFALLRDITERKNAEAAARESEMRYRNLIDFSPYAIMVQIDGRIVFSNPAAAELHGAATTEDLIGMEISDLMHPDERDLHFRRRAEISSTENPLQIIEQRRRRLDGLEVFVESRGIPIRWDGVAAILGISQDIGERRQREIALGESERRYRSLVEMSPNAIWVVRDGRVAFANDAMAKLLGMTDANKLIDRDGLDFVSDEDREQLRNWRRKLLAKNWAGPWIERQLIRADGSLVDVDAYAARIEWNNKPSVLVMFKDLTSRRLAHAASRENELRRRELERNLSDLSRTSAIGELSSTLAHELNQPLAAIVNYLEAGREAVKSAAAPVPGRTDEMMDKALQQANRATEIVRNLRDMVLQASTTRADEDINEVVSEVSSLGLINAEKDGIQTHFILDQSLPRAPINKIQIQQVILNLLRNGVEAMAECDAPTLTITTSLKDGCVQVTIADTGPGLSDDIRDRLFEPFVSTKPSGMGLGLAICQSIIEAHDGELTTTPNQGGGTIFQILLPIKDQTVG